VSVAALGLAAGGTAAHALTGVVGHAVIGLDGSGTVGVPPVPPTPPSTFIDVLRALLECARVELAATAAGAPDTTRVCAVPGALAWDECQCGQLSGTITRIYRSSQFPAGAQLVSTARGCGPPYVVADMAITILRCAPTVDSGSRGPTCDQLEDAARTWFADAFAVRHGVMCCAEDMKVANTVAAFALGSQHALGPEGGCVGSELAVSVGMWDRTCC